MCNIKNLIIIIIIMTLLLWFSFFFVGESYCVNKNVCSTNVKATSDTRVLMLQSVTMWMYEHVSEKSE